MSSEQLVECKTAVVRESWRCVGLAVVKRVKRDFAGQQGVDIVEAAAERDRRSEGGG